MTHVRHGLDLFQRQPEPDEGTVVPRSLSAEHVPRENPDYQIVNGQRKRRQRRQRQCKVCSSRKRNVGEHRATKYYCPGCSPSGKHVWPHTSGRDIQNCEAGGGTGKRKRHRRSLNGEDVDESAENTADDEVTGSNTVGDVSGQGAVDDDAVHEDGAEENAADEAAAEERAAEENDENEDGA
ncbi:hypothetical protein PC129_g12081 [Phytophthora cactorum]|uniref:PiggyBac transposable element-derived protein 4 C-terminal zinc-ribbon domain-containing protein n=1 Tax=Phytophthora cactorum TaxID=29920 RepID=A0A8T0Z9R8_9STRA|nr:hypothetical protein PC111_g8055 [Phytophthora cactorum]KAG2858732.1 hypothetical protein PC113_g9546 [Phytophthora cactorum]KAG2984708.1 hypothetical protein PC118_g8717 [Phytophthora cactorum]KAG3020913.1 hypothetical protein PC119_g9776 [Phytophthora cactorum]KAG3217081.1 hypothetical protein PC129_g12081 [Phytophthora cactorum]